MPLVRTSPSGGWTGPPRTKNPPTSASATPWRAHQAGSGVGRGKRRTRTARAQGVVGGDMEGRRGAVGEPQALDAQVRRPAHGAADQDVAAERAAERPASCPQRRRPRRPG